MKNNRKPKNPKVTRPKRKIPKDLPHDGDWVKGEIAKGTSGQEILRVSDGEMGEYYDAACLFFEREMYLDAAHTFHFLVTLNPKMHEYWLGLAMSVQMCGDYEGALEAYEMASLNALRSPIAYFYLAQCFFALHDHYNGLIALDLVVESAGNRLEFREVKIQAIKVKRFLLESSEPNI